MDVLLVNPFAYDCTAYDFWSKPKGLLEIGRRLQALGVTVELIDCLDRSDRGMASFAASHPAIRPATARKYGTGRFFHEEAEKPATLADFPRRFYRYGYHPDYLRRKLAALDRRPKLVMVTGIMTYWWSGVRETIAIIHETWPDIPVILGGIYPSLLPEHARQYSGADHIFTGEATSERLAELCRHHGIRTAPPAPAPLFYPYLQAGYGVINTSEGCCYGCIYCASKILRPRFAPRPAADVFADLRELAERGIRDIAFYDDALLFQKESRLLPLLRRVADELPPLRFHTPNGLHLDFIDRETARLMYRAGFTTLRFGFETANPELNRKTGFKLPLERFAERIAILKEAGFHGDQIGIYVMIGIPGQTVTDVEESLAFVQRCGVRTNLTEFSPIPGTRGFAAALAASPVDFAAHPELQNNTLLPLRDPTFTIETVNHLKNLCYGQNRKPVQPSHLPPMPESTGYNVA